METILTNLFLHNWQQKIVAVITALVIWLFVNHSIIDTKTITNIPVRIVNLPPDKTIVGLMPNGVLSKRITLILSGKKDVIDDLEPGDLEVLLDASMADQEEWIVSIAKKNLVSLNPDIDINKNITAINHSEFVIKLSRLMTVKIPITILQPTGEAPPGYEYLDFWPQKLTQTISGPEEEVQKLRARGLEIIFDLSEITKDELDSIKSSPGNFHDDEIRYLVPGKWKQVVIPFRNAQEEINDPEAQTLRIYFLRKQTIPLDREVPFAVFYPLASSDILNPASLKVVPGKYVHLKNDIPLFTVPLYTTDVSRLFLSIVRDNLQISIIAAPHGEREILEWSLEVINHNELEDTYVAFLINHLSGGKGGQNAIPKRREQLIRKRFRDYLQRLTLYSSPDKKLNIESTIEDGKLMILSY